MLTQINGSILGLINDRLVRLFYAKDRSLVRTSYVEEVSVSKICVRDHVRNRSDAKRMSSRFPEKKNDKENRRLVSLTCYM